jgi:hypothetical protein
MASRAAGHPISRRQPLRAVACGGATLAAPVSLRAQAPLSVHFVAQRRLISISASI